MQQCGAGAHGGEGQGAGLAGEGGGGGQGGGAGGGQGRAEHWGRGILEAAGPGQLQVGPGLEIAGFREALGRKYCF